MKNKNFLYDEIMTIELLIKQLTDNETFNNKTYIIKKILEYNKFYLTNEIVKYYLTYLQIFLSEIESSKISNNDKQKTKEDIIIMISFNLISKCQDIVIKELTEMLSKYETIINKNNNKKMHKCKKFNNLKTIQKNNIKK